LSRGATLQAIELLIGPAKIILPSTTSATFQLMREPSRLEQAFNDYFDMSMLKKHDGDSYSTQEKSRGRQETRLALTNTDLSVLGDLGLEWPELKTMGIVASLRQKEEVAKESEFTVNSD
jgi:hypothetical protein